MKFRIDNEKRVSGTKNFVTGDFSPSNQIIESYKENYSSGHKKVLSMARNDFPTDVDVSWLPAAASTYDISPDINDYIICDVMALTSCIPNRNLQCFPYEELTYFDSAYGKMIYQTFVGKPSCMDHKNNVDENTDYAKGVIFAAALQHVPDFDIYKVRLLQGFDRTKDTKLAADLLSGKRKYYSMGALVSNFVCPVCGTVEDAMSPCVCMRAGKGKTYMDHLIYQLCLGAVFIENSSVLDPADPFAEGCTI